ncbi:MAG: hypothetical protein ABSG01_00420 [Anaerolineales bacterium]|jgi:hypothetical protein
MTPNAERAMQEVIQKFQTGELSEIIKIAAFEIPDSWPASRWSMGNKMLAYVQARTLNARGFQAWKEVKRQVKKGAHGIYIWAPRMIKKDENGEDKTQLIGFLPVAVFPIETTEGEPLKEDLTPRELPPLFEVATRLGVTVKFQPVAPDRLGDCGHDLINLGTDDPRVFWHELAHAAHQVIDLEYKDRSSQYKEVVAEFTACVIAALYGQDYTGTSWGYLKMFSDDPLKAIMKVGQHIDQVLKLILE